MFISKQNLNINHTQENNASTNEPVLVLKILALKTIFHLQF